MSEATKKQEKKGNGLKIIIIILLALVLIAGGIFGGYFVSNKLKEKTASNSKVASTENVVLDEKTFALDEFIVNLNEKDSSRYLKAKIYLGYVNNKEVEKFEEELNDKKYILRDTVNAVLRSKKTQDIQEANLKKIKEEIKNKINPNLNKGQIKDVYFSEIIVQ